MRLEEFFDVFCHRITPYAVQQKDGGYLKVDSLLTKPLLKSHINEEITLGAYTIDEKNTCRYLCIDVDDEDKFVPVERKLRELKVPFLKETTGGRGRHYWIIFEKPTDSKAVYALGKRLKKCIDPTIEIFPKQASLSNGELGNLVKVPLGIHQKYRGKSQFHSNKIKYTSVEDIILPAPEPKADERSLSLALNNQQMPCTEKMLKGCKEGEGRDETALRLAIRFFRSGLPIKIAWKLMKKFNENCAPPLASNVLETKLEQGYKGKYGLGCTNSLIEQYCDPSCKLYEKIKKPFCSEDELIPDKGFLKYYIKYNSGNDAPTIFHLLTGLFIIATIVNNKIWVNPFGVKNIYPNLYILFTAPSGHRKTTAMEVGKNLLEGFDDSLLLPDSVASYEAYLSCFVDQPQSSIVISEFSRFLRRLQVEGMGGVKDIITELYDCPPSHKVFSKGEGYFRIENPCINVLAGCTPVYLETSTKPEDWQEGFMGRFIVINATKSTFKGISERTIQEQKMKKKIIDWFSGLEKQKGELDFSEIKEDINKTIETYSYNKNELLVGFYNRATDYLIKLSMLYHLSMSKEKVVSKEAFKYANKLFGYIEKTYSSMLDDLSLTKESKDINRIYRMIRDSKDFGIGRSRILQKSGFYSNKLSSIILTLKDAGKIREEQNKYGRSRYFVRESRKEMRLSE